MSFDPSTAAPEDGFDPTSAVPDDTPDTRTVLQTAVKVNPDQAAKASQLAKKYDAPEDVLYRNLQNAELIDTVNRYDERLKTSPKLAAALQRKPSLAQQAHDDIEPLAQIESNIAATTAASLTSGVLSLAEGVWRIPDAAQRATGYVAGQIERTGLPKELNPVRGLQDLIRLVSEGSLPTGYKFGAGTTDVANSVKSATGLLSSDTSTFGSAFADNATMGQNADKALAAAIKTGDTKQLAQVVTNPQYWASFVSNSAPSLLAAIASGGSLQSTMLLEGLDAASSAADFEQRTGKKISDQEFTQAVAQSALINGLLEKFGLDKVMGAEGRGLKGVLQAVFSEGGTEVLQQVNSNLAAQISYDGGQSLTEGLLQSFMGGAGAGGGVNIAHSAATRLQQSVDNQSRKQAQAQASADQLQAQMQAAAQAKLRERNPQEFRELMSHMSDRSVYVDGDVLNQLAPEVRALLPQTVQDQIEIAAGTGDAVEIPVADVLTVAPGTPLEQMFVEHARTDPFAMSQAESKAAGEKAGEYLRTQSEEAIAAAADQEAFRASSEAVRQNILNQLNEAGRYRPAVNEGMAQWAGAFYTTMASRLGMTPEQMHQQFPLRILSEPRSAGQVMDQGERSYPLAHRDEWYGEGTYKENGGRMVYVTPDEYLAAVRPLTLDEESRENIDLLKEHIQSGKTLDPLLIRANGKEDGRHRAYAAKELGIKQVPVIAYGDHFANAPAVDEVVFNQTTTSLPPAIEIDGKQRPTTNSNGQPIAATEEGVRNFWKWFGDSKVVDADGKPLVVYHGSPTPEGITEFSPGGKQGSRLSGDAYGVASYFTSSPGEASIYARDDGAVLPVYVRGEILDVDSKLSEVQSDRVSQLASEVMLPSDKARFAIGREVRSFYDVQDARDFFDAQRKNWEAFGDGMDRAKPEARADGGEYQVEFTNFDADVRIETGEDAFTLFKAIGFDNIAAAGFDGLMFARDGGAKWVVMQRPETNVKSAIGNSGEFDPVNPNILMQSGSERDLMVTHNLTVANLLHADKMGGLAVPSLAITKKDTPLESFGEITLIGPPEMADPKGYAKTQVFGADIYSPRYPSVERELDSKAWAVFRKKFEPMADEMGIRLPDRDDVERDGFEKLVTNIAVMGQFLRDQGVEPRIVMRKGYIDDARRARLEEFGLGPWMDKTSVFDMLDDPDFVKLAAEESASAYRESGDDRMIARADKMVNDPATSRNIARDLANRIAADAKQRAKPEADKYETQKALDEQIEGGDLKGKFEEYVKDQLAGMTKSERIPQGYTNSGNRKYIPHTLENVVKILKKELRGGENFNYGVGSVRAKFTPQFKSVAQIKKEKSRLISAEQFDAIKDEINKEFSNMADAMNIRSETLSAIMEDGATQGLERAAKTYSVDLTGGRAEQIAEFMDKLRNLPTAYFEAKILRDVSLSEFKAAVVPEGVDAKVLDALRKAGITDIRTYSKNDETDRAAKIGEFRDLFFQNHQAPRGTFNPKTLELVLNPNADLSTFFHETGHFFLEVMADIASQPNAPAQIADDMNKLLSWFGVADMATWNSMTLDQKRPYHERFAESVEQYLMEGKAPSLELQPVMRRFRAWLLSVYKSIKQFIASKPGSEQMPLNDDIRRVMDRMLATDEQIAQANEVAGLVPDETADGEAAERLQKRSIADLKWAVKARDKALKALRAQAKTIEKGIREQVTAEVDATPEMQAKAALDKLRKAKELNDATRATVADAFGYANTDEMLQAIDAYGKRSEVIDALTERRMLEEHGDLIDERAIQEAANEAVHNEARARSLATELRTQSEMLNPRQDTGRVNSKGSKITVNALVEAAKQYGQNVADRTVLKDLKNKAWQHTAAERRASTRWKEATAKGDTQAAVKAKQDQMLNNAAAKAVIDAKNEAAKIFEFFKRVTKGNDEKVVEGGRDADIVNAARAVLAAYGVETTTTKKADAYLDLVKRNDPDTYGIIFPMVDVALREAQPLESLTVEQLRSLNEDIEAIWYKAKQSRQMEIDGDLMDRQDIEDQLKTQIQEVGVPDHMPGDTSAITPREQAALKLKHYLATARRVESWAQGLDGSKKLGPFRKFIWQPVKEAADALRVDKAKYLKRYRDLLKGVESTLVKETIAAPELGYTFGKDTDGVAMAEVLHAILHTGNESNKRKLLLGRGWAIENQDGTLDTRKWDAFVARMISEGKITKAHYDFAQGVWDLLEDTKPLAQKAHRYVFGRYFAEVTADAFDTPFGQYRGGYVPAQTDARIVSDAATRALAEAENDSMQFAFPTTNKGFTKSRVEYNRPLLLDLRALSQHIDKVLLFSHMEQPVRDVRKLLTAKGVAYGLNRIDPVAFDTILTPWLNRAAKQLVATPAPNNWQGWRFWSTLRNRAGMAAMFGNIANAVQQVAGFSLAAVKVKPKHLMGATAQFIANPKKTSEMVASKSAYMDGRLANEVANMNDAINEILVNPNVYEKTKNFTAKHAYFVQSAVDSVMGPIIWSGAYNQALAEGFEDRDAVRLADSAVRETQGSTSPEDISAFEEGSPFSRLFTQFAGYFNMQANLLGTEFQVLAREMGLKKGVGRGLYVLTFGFLVNAWAAEAIMQLFKGGPDDEDKDGEYLDDWLKQVFGWSLLRNTTAMVPVFGQAANALVNATNSKPYDDRMATSPAISMLESAAKAPMSVYKAIAEDGKVSRAVRDVGTLIAMTVGIPLAPITKPLGYAADVDQGNVKPTSPVDAARGAVTGVASPESKR